MTNQVTRPTNAKIQQENKKLEMGLMGRVFGGASEKPGNIAGISIVLSFVGIIAIALWVPDTTSSPKSELLTLFGSIITGAIGFLFGRTTSS